MSIRVISRPQESEAIVHELYITEHEKRGGEKVVWVNCDTHGHTIMSILDDKVIVWKDTCYTKKGGVVEA